jgi:hypothetical protein
MELTILVFFTSFYRNQTQFCTLKLHANQRNVRNEKYRRKINDEVSVFVVIWFHTSREVPASIQDLLITKLVIRPLYVLLYNFFVFKFYWKPRFFASANEYICFSREQAKSGCDWVVMLSVFVASQSSCFLLRSHEQTLLVEIRL